MTLNKLILNNAITTEKVIAEKKVIVNSFMQMEYVKFSCQIKSAGWNIVNYDIQKTAGIINEVLVIEETYADTFMNLLTNLVIAVEKYQYRYTIVSFARKTFVLSAQLRQHMKQTSTMMAQNLRAVSTFIKNSNCGVVLL